MTASEGTLATRTYLEMRDRGALRPAHVDNPDISISRVEAPDPSLWRWLYTEVGREYRWFDRLGWTDAEASAYLEDPHVSLWLLTVRGETAGYFELRRDDDGAVEIVYFGLLPAFTGQHLGGHLLTEAVERAWSQGASRVWLHTCSFDHPAAIPNYIKRGFTIFRIEQYQPSPSILQNPE
jgi:ribosomal protein S18 acetylase RimI-like enzyme